MSYDQFIHITHFLLAMNSGFGVKSRWRLDNWTYFLLLVYFSCETSFLLYVLSSA